MPYVPPATNSTSTDLPAVNTVPTTDETIATNNTVVALEEYVMDATNELIFADPSEMSVE